MKKTIWNDNAIKVELNWILKHDIKMRGGKLGKEKFEWEIAWKNREGKSERDSAVTQQRNANERRNKEELKRGRGERQRTDYDEWNQGFAMLHKE